MSENSINFDYQLYRVRVYPVTESELEMLRSRWVSASTRKRIVDRIFSQSTPVNDPPTDAGKGAGE